MPIRPIVKTHYATNEVETLIKGFSNALRPLIAIQPLVKALFGRLTIAMVAIQEANRNSNHNAKTELILKAEKTRNLAFKAFYGVIEAGTLRQNDKHRKACLKIMAYVERFDRRLVKYNCAKESVELKELFIEMEQVQNEIESVQLSTWLSELKNAEQYCINLQQEKNSKEIKNKVIMSNENARNKGLNELIKVSEKLNDLESDGTQGIADLNSRLDSLIADLEVPIIKSRNKKNDEMEKELEMA
ncbi:DUF6261 family protein [Reichenbachiella versicolor]|uniref:DUF6261 family protein n=1 Tax=Reichenbachiella versicolor TaxID=1821036 RepID=UPI000D6EA37A|nr:DUF6261 family protein [Reichenbachiella versicolor]